jgi:hypothetical protein
MKTLFTDQTLTLLEAKPLLGRLCGADLSLMTAKYGQ